MKVTKEKATENRTALIMAASRLFRERGIDGVGIAEICKQAGLTHGALYAQFPTKQALAAEALADGLTLSNRWLTAPGEDGKPPTLAHYLDYYLSPGSRDNMGGSCPMTASASEIARQDESISASFGEGFEQLAQAIEAALGKSHINASERERALAIMAALIGGVAVARGVVKANPALSEQLMQALRRVLGELGGEREGREVN